MGENIIGIRMKSLRENKDLKQNKVAGELSVSPYQLSRYENGKSKPDPELIAKIATYYDVTTDYLLGIIDNPQPINKVIVAGQEITLSIEEAIVFNELKKHPALFHDLATNPEAKIKELIKLSKMKKMFLEEDESEYGDGFGELED